MYTLEEQAIHFAEKAFAGQKRIKEDIEEIKSAIPLNRIGSPLSIAKCVKWLIEDNYTTGQIISINGGWIC